MPLEVVCSTLPDDRISVEVFVSSSWGFHVARFGNLGNARAFTSWNERQTGSTLFLCVFE